MKKLLTISIGAAVFCGVASLVPIASAQNGTWTAHPGQSISYVAAIQQPINAEGDSIFSGRGHNVIPIKFALSQGTGPFVFESIGSPSPSQNAESWVSFAPNTPLTFNQIMSLSAVYLFSLGDCHGGSLRWQVDTSLGNVHIYYGNPPNFGNGNFGGCTPTSPGGVDQTGANLIGLSDLRYDTSDIAGGTFYDTYEHTQTLIGDTPIIRISLILDSGWGGDQRLTLTSATVNTNIFEPQPSSSPTPVCPTAEATIGITKTSTFASGEEPAPTSIQPRDNDMIFRIVDCKYMYNLGTSSLGGIGTYNVTATIDGQPFDVATFSLR